MDSGKSKGSSTDQELAWWVLGIVGLLALQRLWTVRAKPWLEETVPALRDGDRLDIVGVGISVVDLVVLGVLAVAVLTVVLLIRSSVRARRRRRELDRTS